MSLFCLNVPFSFLISLCLSYATSDFAQATHNPRITRHLLGPKTQSLNREHLHADVTEVGSREREGSDLQELKEEPKRVVSKTFGPKGWFWRMFPRNENRNEGTFGCSPGTKTGTRVRSPKPPFYQTALLSPSGIYWGGGVKNIEFSVGRCERVLHSMGREV